MQNSESSLVRFAREYGWRAYAIPVLLVITIWILVDIVHEPAEPIHHEIAASEPAPQSRGAGPIPADADPISLATGQLPDGGPFTETGEDTFRVVGSPGPKVGEGKEHPITYVVEIENGVNTAAYGGDAAVAAMIDATLANPKGWTADPAFSFQHVAPDQNPTLRIQLTSVGTTHAVCGDDLKMETSCYMPVGERVLLNESRWVRGAVTAQGDIGSYRQYLINHEVGHALGYAEHAVCPATGELAPIMMQQTLSLNNSELHRIDPHEVYRDDQVSCGFNPWPFPRS
ncbi:DUF3152 domain-containing protein [Corynebacterium sp. H128]|uniref:DUF3152 domain-containing protein n=1 Tax=unclassified Corynebacterium TaxID=2624378 RepID=UPI0030B5EE3A